MTVINKDRGDLQAWLETIAQAYGLKLDTLTPASADAGFREYLRVTDQKGQTYIVMNAARDSRESFDAFIKIDALFADEAGLRVPKIHEVNRQERFMLLSDLGRQTYLDVLNEDNAARLMGKATDALVKWQAISKPEVLPEYSREVLRAELELFPQWYVSRHRNVQWTEQQKKWWDMSVEAILDNVCAQSKVYVHRDFMPRNLMDCGDEAGILDFQDAMYGPVSYDIASLLRDAFISWSDTFVLDTTIRYWEKARKAGIEVPADFGRFYRDIDFMSAQRHLKVLGIFARLNYRDGKAKYLQDTPRFIAYLRKTAGRYVELSPLARLIDELEGSDKTVGYTF